MYVSTKTYGHQLGLSACFRQHKAHSHCRLLHGYALQIHLEFEADELDDRNWVVDFGSLKSFKQQLEDTFDHKLLVAEDDPALPFLLKLGVEETGLSADRDEDIRPRLAEVVVVKATGCEAFSELVFECAELWLKDAGYAPRVRMRSVTVSEHGANSASFGPKVRRAA